MAITIVRREVVVGIIGLLLLVTIEVASIYLGALIFASDKKSKINQWFLSIAICIFFWNIFAYLGYNSNNVVASAIYFRLNFFAVSMYFISSYYFATYFPVASRKRIQIIDYFVTFIALVFAVLSISTDSVIKSVEVPVSGKLVMNMGVAGNYFYLFTILLTIFILFVIFQKNRSLSTSNKSKIRYFLFGIILYALSNFIFSIGVAVLYPQNYNYTQFGDFSAILFLGFTAYAIMKHQLFNIKVIATESIVIILSLGLLIQIFISGTTTEYVLKFIVWLLATYGGLMLIKSVKHEIKQREELESLAKKLKEANADLTDLDRMKDEFLQMATHELNTPITVIQGKLNMAIDEDMCHLNEEQKSFLRPILNDSVRLADLSRDILNTARIDQNRLKLNVQKNNLDELISQVVEGMQLPAKEKNNTIAYVPAAGPLPEIPCDRSKISEVITNLISNANKFTEHGQILVGARIDNDQLIVSVTDTGIGISPEDCKNLFKKFSQVGRFNPNNPQEQQGSGLGLFISKHIIELHGGKIWLESDEGKGSTFYFSLPLEYKEINLPNKLHIEESKLRVL